MNNFTDSLHLLCAVTLCLCSFTPAVLSILACMATKNSCFSMAAPHCFVRLETANHLPFALGFFICWLLVSVLSHLE